jgi:hypothetical protein
MLISVPIFVQDFFCENLNPTFFRRGQFFPNGAEARNEAATGVDAEFCFLSDFTLLDSAFGQISREKQALG